MIDKLITSIFNYLLVNSHSKFNLKALTFILNQKIAFNLAHKIKICSLEVDHAQVSIPLIRQNTNHLRTIHACAMATVGEFTAGLLLLKSFDVSEYRLIMKEMHVDFKKQAKTNLTATVKDAETFLSSARKELATDQISLIKIETSIADTNQLEVAVVTTTWQLKKWSQTKFK